MSILNQDSRKDNQTCGNVRNWEHIQPYYWSKYPWGSKNAPIIREQTVSEAECEAWRGAGPGEDGEAEAGRGELPASGEAHQARAPLSREAPGRNGSIHSASGEISLFLQLIYYFLLWALPASFTRQFYLVFTSCCMQPVRQSGIHPCWTWQTLWHD